MDITGAFAAITGMQFGWPEVDLVTAQGSDSLKDGMKSTTDPLTPNDLFENIFGNAKKKENNQLGAIKGFKAKHFNIIYGKAVAEQAACPYFVDREFTPEGKARADSYTVFAKSYMKELDAFYDTDLKIIHGALQWAVTGVDPVTEAEQKGMEAAQKAMDQFKNLKQQAQQLQQQANQLSNQIEAGEAQVQQLNQQINDLQSDLSTLQDLLAGQTAQGVTPANIENVQNLQAGIEGVQSQIGNAQSQINNIQSNQIPNAQQQIDQLNQQGADLIEPTQDLLGSEGMDFYNDLSNGLELTAAQNELANLQQQLAQPGLNQQQVQAAQAQANQLQQKIDNLQNQGVQPMGQDLDDADLKQKLDDLKNGKISPEDFKDFFEQWKNQEIEKAQKLMDDILNTNFPSEADKKMGEIEQIEAAAQQFNNNDVMQLWMEAVPRICGIDESAIFVAEAPVIAGYIDLITADVGVVKGLGEIANKDAFLSAVFTGSRSYETLMNVLAVYDKYVASLVLIEKILYKLIELDDIVMHQMRVNVYREDCCPNGPKDDEGCPVEPPFTAPGEPTVHIGPRHKYEIEPPEEGEEETAQVPPGTPTITNPPTPQPSGTRDPCEGVEVPEGIEDRKFATTEGLYERSGTVTKGDNPDDIRREINAKQDTLMGKMGDAIKRCMNDAKPKAEQAQKDVIKRWPPPGQGSLSGIDMTTPQGQADAAYLGGLHQQLRQRDMDEALAEINAEVKTCIDKARETVDANPGFESDVEGGEFTAKATADGIKLTTEQPRYTVNTKYFLSKDGKEAYAGKPIPSEQVDCVKTKQARNQAKKLGEDADKVKKKLETLIKKRDALKKKTVPKPIKEKPKPTTALDKCEEELADAAFSERQAEAAVKGIEEHIKRKLRGAKVDVDTATGAVTVNGQAMSTDALVDLFGQEYMDTHADKVERLKTAKQTKDAKEKECSKLRALAPPTIEVPKVEPKPTEVKECEEYEIKLVDGKPVTYLPARTGCEDIVNKFEQDIAFERERIESQFKELTEKNKVENVKLDLESGEIKQDGKVLTEGTFGDLMLDRSAQKEAIALYTDVRGYGRNTKNLKKAKEECESKPPEERKSRPEQTVYADESDPCYNDRLLDGYNKAINTLRAQYAGLRAKQTYVASTLPETTAEDLRNLVENTVADILRATGVSEDEIKRRLANPAIVSALANDIERKTQVPFTKVLEAYSAAMKDTELEYAKDKITMYDLLSSVRPLTDIELKDLAQARVTAHVLTNPSASGVQFRRSINNLFRQLGYDQSRTEEAVESLIKTSTGQVAILTKAGIDKKIQVDLIIQLATTLDPTKLAKEMINRYVPQKTREYFENLGVTLTFDPKTSEFSFEGTLPKPTTIEESDDRYEHLLKLKSFAGWHLRKDLAISQRAPAQEIGTGKDLYQNVRNVESWIERSAIEHANNQPTQLWRVLDPKTQSTIYLDVLESLDPSFKDELRSHIMEISFVERQRLREELAENRKEADSAFESGQTSLGEAHRKVEYLIDDQLLGLDVISVWLDPANTRGITNRIARDTGTKTTHALKGQIQPYEVNEHLGRIQDLETRSYVRNLRLRLEKEGKSPEEIERILKSDATRMNAFAAGMSAVTRAIFKELKPAYQYSHESRNEYKHNTEAYIKILTNHLKSLEPILLKKPAGIEAQSAWLGMWADAITIIKDLREIAEDEYFTVHSEGILIPEFGFSKWVKGYQQYMSYIGITPSATEHFDNEMEYMSGIINGLNRIRTLKGSTWEERAAQLNEEDWKFLRTVGILDENYEIAINNEVVNRYDSREFYTPWAVDAVVNYDHVVQLEIMLISGYFAGTLSGGMLIAEGFLFHEINNVIHATGDSIVEGKNWFTAFAAQDHTLQGIANSYAFLGMSRLGSKFVQHVSSRLTSNVLERAGLWTFTVGTEAGLFTTYSYVTGGIPDDEFGTHYLNMLVDMAVFKSITRAPPNKRMQQRSEIADRSSEYVKRRIAELERQRTEVERQRDKSEIGAKTARERLSEILQLRADALHILAGRLYAEGKKTLAKDAVKRYWEATKNSAAASQASLSKVDPMFNFKAARNSHNLALSRFKQNPTLTNYFAVLRARERLIAEGEVILETVKDKMSKAEYEWTKAQFARQSEVNVKLTDINTMLSEARTGRAAEESLTKAENAVAALPEGLARTAIGNRVRQVRASQEGRPATTVVLEAPPAKPRNPAITRALNRVLKAQKHVKSLPTRVRSAIELTFEQLLAGEITPEQARARIQAQLGTLAAEAIPNKGRAVQEIMDTFLKSLDAKTRAEDPVLSRMNERVELGGFSASTRKTIIDILANHRYGIDSGTDVRASLTAFLTQRGVKRPATVANEIFRLYEEIYRQQLRPRTTEAIPREPPVRPRPEVESRVRAAIEKSTVVKELHEPLIRMLTAMHDLLPANERTRLLENPVAFASETLRAHGTSLEGFEGILRAGELKTTSGRPFFAEDVVWTTDTLTRAFTYALSDIKKPGAIFIFEESALRDVSTGEIEQTFLGAKSKYFGHRENIPLSKVKNILVSEEAYQELKTTYADVDFGRGRTFEDVVKPYPPKARPPRITEAIPREPPVRPRPTAERAPPTRVEAPPTEPIRTLEEAIPGETEGPATGRKTVGRALTDAAAESRVTTGGELGAPFRIGYGIYKNLKKVHINDVPPGSKLALTSTSGKKYDVTLDRVESDRIVVTMPDGTKAQILKSKIKTFRIHETGKPKPTEAVPREPPAAPRPAEPKVTEQVTVPERVSSLSSSWQSQVGQIPGLTRQLEAGFRMGHTVDTVPGKPGQYRLGGTVQGGETIMMRLVGEREYKAYQAWRARESIPPVKSNAEARQAHDALRAFLATRGIKLTNYAGTGWQAGGIFKHTLALLKLLPESYLRHGKIKEIVLGAERTSAALGSEWKTETGSVYIFGFLMQSGAQRPFSGLFMHEMGHGSAEIIETMPQAARVKSAWDTIPERAMYEARFWQGGGNRQNYQKFTYHEFLAETFMIYTTQGDALRSHIRGIADPKVREAYQTVYDTFKELLGREYTRERAEAERKAAEREAKELERRLEEAEREPAAPPRPTIPEANSVSEAVTLAAGNAIVRGSELRKLAQAADSRARIEDVLHRLVAGELTPTQARARLNAIIGELRPRKAGETVDRGQAVQDILDQLAPRVPRETKLSDPGFLRVTTVYQPLLAQYQVPAESIRAILSDYKFGKRSRSDAVSDITQELVNRGVASPAKTAERIMETYEKAPTKAERPETAAVTAVPRGERYVELRVTEEGTTSLEAIVARHEQFKASEPKYDAQPVDRMLRMVEEGRATENDVILALRRGARLPDRAPLDRTVEYVLRDNPGQPRNPSWARSVDRITQDNIDAIADWEYVPGLHGTKAISYLTPEGNVGVRYWERSQQVHHRDALSTVLEHQGRHDAARAIGRRGRELHPPGILRTAAGIQITYDRTTGKIVRIDGDSSLTRAQVSDKTPIDAEAYAEHFIRVIESIDPRLLPDTLLIRTHDALNMDFEHFETVLRARTGINLRVETSKGFPPEEARAGTQAAPPSGLSGELTSNINDRLKDIASSRTTHIGFVLAAILVLGILAMQAIVRRRRRPRSRVEAIRDDLDSSMKKLEEFKKRWKH